MRWRRFREVALGFENRQLIAVGWAHVENPALSPELMAHLHHHLPQWTGFRQQVFTYVETEWNSIYGDVEVLPGAAVTTEAQPLGRRDHLEQIFAACPEGSYGYYAQFGLAPFKSLVGNFASATIDEFFASQVHFLKQPMSAMVNDIMSTLETHYWNSREDIIDYIAGRVMTKGMRHLGVATPQVVMQVWEGKRVPGLGPGETLGDEQLAEVVDLLAQNLGGLDQAAAGRFATELCERMIAENRVNLADAVKE